MSTRHLPWAFCLIAAIRGTAAIVVRIAASAAVAGKQTAQVDVTVQDVQKDQSKNDDPGFVVVFTAGH